MALQVDIRLKRSNKIYHERDNIIGIVRLESLTDYRHDGINLTMEGAVHLKISPKNANMFESITNSVKPIQLTYAFVEISPSGKMPSGVTEIPFEIPLVPRQNRTLHETYHGVFINIQYKLRCDIRRSILTKDASKELEFMVECNKGHFAKDLTLPTKMNQSAIQFSITPDSLRTIYDSRSNLPNFKIEGNLFGTICDINQPFTGEITIKIKEPTLRSIELQLVRVETCGCAEGFSKECTEIQNIQIADGDVPVGVRIPIYMLFPRLFACPTLITTNFKIEFEMNLIIVFADKHLVTENFPVVLVRL